MKPWNTIRQESGQGLVEYIVLVFFLTAAIVSTLLLLGGGAGDLYRESVSAFQRNTPTPDMLGTPVYSDLSVQVVDLNDEGIAQVPVSIFDQSGQYLEEQIQTDDQGWAQFLELEPGEYSFRADYQQKEFWSEVAYVPGMTSTQIQTGQGPLLVEVVNPNGEGIPGVGVSAYKPSGAYVGVTGTTSTGTTTLDLVEGSYIIRANYQGQDYASDVVMFPEQSSVRIEIDLVSFRVNVVNRQGEPAVGVAVHAFNADGQFLGKSAQTNERGSVEIDLNQGRYQFRADSHGRSYWSSTVSIPPSSSTRIEVGPYRVAVKVEDYTGGGISGIPVHLFNSERGYLGKSLQTDSAGIATFSLLDGDYQFRADYAGRSYWSGYLSVPQTQSLIISVGPRQVTVQVTDNRNDPVPDCYLLVYSLDGPYYRFLQWKRSSSDGLAAFQLSPGRYRILAYPSYGYQYKWSSVFNPQNTEQISIKLSRR